jgi:hypothetical protein
MGFSIGKLGMIIIVIIFITFSLIGFWNYSSKSFIDSCRQTVNSKLSSWMEKMDLPDIASTEIDRDEILLGKRCVEFVYKDSIKFKGDDKPMTYPTLTKGHVNFDFVSDKLYPSDSSYVVSVDLKTATVHFIGV